MEKVDFKKELKEFYRPSVKKPVIVDVPLMNFLMIDGRGDPNTSQEYQEALEALYSVSYTLKFMLKNAGIVNYVVMPLEGLWWLEGEKEFDATRKDEWKWTSMIMQPPQVNGNHVAESIELSLAKRDNPALSDLRFTDYHEGLSVQIMHIGPWSEEAPTIEKIHSFIKEQGYTINGKHHEIYLSDPRRTKPEKLKTVIRQPME
ncbi:MAG: GyrI-like domain-containing protein [Candidatus Thorarchaeota archaeon]|jgi:hypothetical protein